MTAENPRESLLRARAREWAREFHEAGLDLEVEPDIALSLTDLDGVRVLRSAGVPSSAGGSALLVDGERYDMRRAADRTIIMEELARGDVGVFLSAPGPSMAGMLVDILGSVEQKEMFFSPFLERPTWSCFALTEPEHGSDASALSATVGTDETHGQRVTGRKKYIGNGSRAATGVVFARRNKSPLSIGAYIVDPTRPEFEATPRATVGLRAALISDISLDRLPLGPGAELGAHLPRGQRGILASLRVFNQLRPGVAALALGVAWNAFDVVATELRTSTSPRLRDEMNRIARELSASRHLVRRAASAADATGDGVLASAAKRSICRQAERVTLDLCRVLGPSSRLEHPRLDKAVRDARGIEFMEGTGNMQVLNVGQAVVTSPDKLRPATG